MPRPKTLTPAQVYERYQERMKVNNKYIKENLVTFTFRIPKRYEKVIETMQKQENRTEYFIKAIENQIKLDEQEQQ